MATRNYREIQKEHLRRSAFGKDRKRPFREYHTPEPVAEKLKRLSRVDENGCHIWMGKINKRRGYGIISYRKNGHRYHRNAHTLAYEVNKGPVPEGMEVSHVCPGGANPRCVNPDHLIAESHAENLKRRRSFPRYKGHVCKRGHSLDGVRLASNGGCPICEKVRVKAWLEKNKERMREYYRRYSLNKKKRSKINGFDEPQL